MYKAKAYSAAHARSPLAATTISRREPTDRDVPYERLLSSKVKYRFSIDIAALKGE